MYAFSDGKQFESEISRVIGNIVNSPVVSTVTTNPDGLRCEVKLSDGSLACRFVLTMFPGNCGIVVSHNTYVASHLRGLGIATALQPIKETIARSGGFSYIMATIIADNIIQSKILPRFGWKILWEFINQRTTNKCIMWIKPLEEV